HDGRIVLDSQRRWRFCRILQGFGKETVKRLLTQSLASAGKLRLHPKRKRLPNPTDGCSRSLDLQQQVDLGQSEDTAFRIGNLVSAVDNGGFHFHQERMLVLGNPFRGYRRHREHAEAQTVDLLRTIGSKAPLDVEDQSRMPCPV